MDAISDEPIQSFPLPAYNIHKAEGTSIDDGPTVGQIVALVSSDSTTKEPKFFLAKRLSYEAYSGEVRFKAQLKDY